MAFAVVTWSSHSRLGRELSEVIISIWSPLFQRLEDGLYLVVHFGADCLVPHIRMDIVGEIQYRRTLRHLSGFSFGGENDDFIGI